MTLEEPVVEEAEAEVANDSAPAAEDTDAQEPSLDELLTQYDEQDEPETSKKEEKPDDDTKLALQYIKSKMQEESEARVATDIEKSVKLAKDAGEVSLPDELVEAYLRQRIQGDGRMLKLWQSRDKNKSGYESVIKSLGRELSKSLGEKIDQNVTDSTDALASAVKGSSKTKPVTEDEPDFLNMSAKELEKWKDKNIQ